MNVSLFLEQHASHNPDRVALYFNDRSWSYGEVHEIVCRLADGLRNLGVQRGDRVAVMLPNWPEFHFCTHATWALGAVEVPVNVMFREEETAYILGNAEAVVVFASSQGAEIIQRVRDRLPHLKAVVTVGAGDVPGAIHFAGLLARGDVNYRVQDLHPDALAVIAYTSGTTGFPKGAMISHYNMIVSMQALRDYLDLTDRDNIMQPLPCFHSNASLIGIIFAWYLGSSAILVERIEARDFARTVEITRPSFFACVPTVLYDIVHMPEAADFSSVRYVVFGAAPTPPELRRRIEQRFGLKMLQSYGMTESPNAYTLDPIDRPIKHAAVGLPLPHLSFKIVDGDDRTLPIGEVGEICAGPQTSGSYAGLYKPMLGYWKNPQATEEALKGGYLHTGDLGRLDEDGFVHVVDRKKDMIIRGGNNIFPAELERALQEDPRVLECAVVGVPHDRLGEVPKAFIRLRPEASASDLEFMDLIERRLARYKRLEAVEFVEEFPRNALGKILKRTLRAQEVEKYQARTVG